MESSNCHLKRRMRQHLLLRGSRDFESEAAYGQFLQHVLERGNHGRQEKLAAELAVMKPLPPTRLQVVLFLDRPSILANRSKLIGRRRSAASLERKSPKMSRAENG